MDSTKDTLNWAQGFERYISAKSILNSESWGQAQTLIERSLKNRKDRGDQNILYYAIGENTLWNEYKFLFLCQFLEFQITELISRLQEGEKIRPEFISELKSNKKAAAERVKEDKRLMSPASLISDFSFNLGCLIDILEKQTNDFSHKSELLEKLKEFNKYRVSFVHHSFVTKKKANGLNLSEVILQGLQSGDEILGLIGIA